MVVVKNTGGSSGCGEWLGFGKAVVSGCEWQ